MLDFNIRTTPKASDWPERNGLKRKEVAAQGTSIADSALLNLRHFADHTALRPCSNTFRSNTLRMASAMHLRISSGTWESRFQQTIGIDQEKTNAE